MSWLKIVEVDLYAKANNPYLIDDYDRSKETSYLGYFDANNLYGWATSQHLPYGLLSWVNTEQEPMEVEINDACGSSTANNSKQNDDIALQTLEKDIEQASEIHLNRLRWGVSSIFYRYDKANNPYLIDDYDWSKETSYLGYFDSNNLYAWAMSQHLPYGFLSWLNTEQEPMEVKINAACGSSTASNSEQKDRGNDTEEAETSGDEDGNGDVSEEFLRNTIMQKTLEEIRRADKLEVDMTNIKNVMV
ncbi:Hypothetical predicted protein [Mytilus galloprovincialis]|uniref:DNA-directed DNA polymerase n=1 Tax=Mytilus galloprovincialis TaxID=29158 RepID=A0A8B6FR08_MYTGA|nr:Hypothetical predicted protein [Mytilus galloprovincialis]